jgi:transcriptional regulator with XRE-family HTH domain
MDLQPRPEREHPIRAARRRERFSLRELAVIVGLDFRRINAIECGARPSQIEARLLAAALRVPLRELLDADAVQR